MAQRTSLHARLGVAVAATMIATAISAAASDAMRVTRQEPVEETELFDAISLPPMTGTFTLTDWAAATSCYFSCNPELDIQHEVVWQGNDRCRVRSTVLGGELELMLSIHTLMPRNAQPRIVEHEEGHSRICRWVYAQAGEMAHVAATEIVGQAFEAEAKTCMEAFVEAIDVRATERFRRRFDGLTRDIAYRGGEYYDLLTQHGSSIAVATDPALEQIELFMAADLRRRMAQPQVASASVSSDARR